MIHSSPSFLPPLVINLSVICWMGFPGGLVVKNPPVSAGDSDLILGSGRSPGEGNGNKLQYSCLGYHMDRAAWQGTIHGVAKSDMAEQLTLSLSSYP